MIKFVFECENEIDKQYALNTMHEALVGSPAYKSSEILLGEEGSKAMLIVGLNNDDNLTIKVGIESEE